MVNLFVISMCSFMGGYKYSSWNNKWVSLETFTLRVAEVYTGGRAGPFSAREPGSVSQTEAGRGYECRHNRMFS